MVFFGIDLGFDYEGTNHFEKSFIVAISVIVIACPCVLALVTPMASLIGISELAKKVYYLKKLNLLKQAVANTVVLIKQEL